MEILNETECQYQGSSSAVAVPRYNYNMVDQQISQSITTKAIHPQSNCKITLMHEFLDSFLFG